MAQLIDDTPYFITVDLLRRYVLLQYPTDDLFAQEVGTAIDETLAEVVTESVFNGHEADYQAWLEFPPEAARLVWEAKTERRKLSALAEAFFRRLAQRMGGPMLLTKGELHRLVRYAELPASAETEICAKLDLLARLFEQARQHGEQIAVTRPARATESAP
jgi:predicted ATPase